MKNETNNKRVTFLLNIKEYEKLSNDAWRNRMSVSEYIRKLIISKNK